MTMTLEEIQAYNCAVLDCIALSKGWPSMMMHSDVEEALRDLMKDYVFCGPLAAPGAGSCAKISGTSIECTIHSSGGSDILSTYTGQSS